MWTGPAESKVRYGTFQPWCDPIAPLPANQPATKYMRWRAPQYTRLCHIHVKHCYKQDQLSLLHQIMWYRNKSWTDSALSQIHGNNQPQQVITVYQTLTSKPLHHRSLYIRTYKPQWFNTIITFYYIDIMSFSQLTWTNWFSKSISCHSITTNNMIFW